MTLIPINQLNSLSSYMPTQQAQMWSGKRGRGALEDYYTTYLEQQAELLPEVYALAEERRQLKEQQRLEEEERKQARRDSYVSLGIRSADVGIKAYPLLKSMATKPPVPALVGDIPSYATPSELALTEGTTPLMPSYSTEIGAGAKTAMPIVGEAGKSTGYWGGKLAKLGGKGAVSAGGLGSYAGSLYKGASEEYGWGEKLHKSVKEIGEKEWDRGGSALSGAVAGFVASGFNPVGAIIGGIAGLFGGW